MISHTSVINEWLLFSSDASWGILSFAYAAFGPCAGLSARTVLNDSFKTPSEWRQWRAVSQRRGRPVPVSAIINVCLQTMRRNPPEYSWIIKNTPRWLNWLPLHGNTFIFSPHTYFIGPWRNRQSLAICLRSSASPGIGLENKNTLDRREHPTSRRWAEDPTGRVLFRRSGLRPAVCLEPNKLWRRPQDWSPCIYLNKHQAYESR